MPSQTPPPNQHTLKYPSINRHHDPKGVEEKEKLLRQPMSMHHVNIRNDSDDWSPDDSIVSRTRRSSSVSARDGWFIPMCVWLHSKRTSVYISMAVFAVLVLVCFLISEHNSTYQLWAHRRQYPSTEVSFYSTTQPIPLAYAVTPPESESELAGLTKEPLDIVVIVPTVFTWKDRREVLRKQWSRSMKLAQATFGEAKPLRAKLFFIFGKHGLSDEQLALVQEEKKAHPESEILVLSDVNDIDPDNGDGNTLESSTTLKVFLAVRWAVQHFTFQDLARVGDDAYFNIVEYWRTRHTLPKERLLLGRWNYDRLDKDPGLQQLYRAQQFPPYPLGMGYILTYDVAAWLAHSTLPFVMTSPEDALVGMWTAGLHLHRVDDERVHNINSAPEKWSLVPCVSTDILIHYMHISDWDNIDDKGVLHC